MIVVLPDREVDLGAFKFGDRITFRKWRSGSEWQYEFEKITAAAPGADASSQAGASTGQ
jgi:hypothetical protein